VIMAIVPAIGEEMFFRGILLRFVRKGVVNRAIRRADRTGNPVETGRTMFIPIIFTAAFFAMSHSNPYGYPSIFLAGVLLAVIYNLTGSLWCNIIGHLFFNGTQVILAYVGGTNDAVKKFMDGSSVPAYMIVSGAIVFGISFYLLWKNRTPLQANWSDDFTPMELAFFREENQS
jgi:membrane protease YdiL (CAAX protease family)